MKHLIIFLSLICSFAAVSETLWDQRQDSIREQMLERAAQAQAQNEANSQAHMAQLVASCTGITNVVNNGRTRSGGWSPSGRPAFIAGDWACIVIGGATVAKRFHRVSCTNGQQRALSCPVRGI